MAAGRPKNEGQPRKYVVADDVHEWIIGHGGGRYLTDTIRAIKSQYQKPWDLYFRNCLRSAGTWADGTGLLFQNSWCFSF